MVAAAVAALYDKAARPMFPRWLCWYAIWAGFTFERYGPGAPFWISAALALATLAFASGLTADTPESGAAPKAPKADAAEPEAAAGSGA